MEKNLSKQESESTEKLKELCKVLNIELPKGFKIYFLSKSESELIEFIRDLEYGTIHELEVHDGVPSMFKIKGENFDKKVKLNNE